MIAGYDQAFPSGYAAAISVELSDSSIEQIRKLVNLLMVFSMLLSMITPIYAPVGFALPSYAFFDGSSAPAAQPLAAQPVRSAPPAALESTAAESQLLPRGGAGVVLGEALAPAWFAAPAAPPQFAGDAAVLGTALTPVWLAETPAAAALAPLAAPWWRDPAAATLRSADIRALAPAADADAIGADLRAPEELAAPLPDAASAPAELGSAIAPAWLAATTAAPVATDLRGSLRLPNWAPLSFAAGICTGNSEFSWTSSAPISMTMGNNTAVYTFTAVIANNSITPTGPLTYVLQLPPNFSFVSGSATAVSSVSGTLTTVQAGANTTGTITLRASATPVSNTLMPGSAVTLTYQLRGGPNGAPNPDVVANIVSGDESNPNCIVNNPVSTNFCPLAGELALQLTPPPFLISYGNTNGDRYTVTLRNNGSYTMTDVSFEVNPNADFFFKGGTAEGVNSLGDTLTFTQPMVDTAEDASFVLRVANPYPASSIAPGETITVVMRLGTDNEPKSGQPLLVTARSGSTGAELACTTTRENIATGRGHLFVRKIVEPTTAAVGDPVTFTILLDNTGLGSIYNAEFNESLGSGVRLLPASVLIPDEIKPNSSYSFTVPAEVTSCVGATNTVSAWWPVGNIDNTATVANPSTAAAAVRVSNPAPVISIQADLPDVEYCKPVVFTVDVPLTITNSGQGPAANFTLLPQDIDTVLNFTFSTSTPGWVKSGSVFSYTENDGLLEAGTSANLTLTLTYTPTRVCNANAGAFSVTPSYSDACFPELRSTGPSTNFNLTSPNPPSLNVTKESSIDADRLEIMNPGDTVYFTVTAFGATGDISGTQVHIIDTLPSSLVTANLITVTTPGAEHANGVVQYTPTITTSPTYSFTLYIQATYRDRVCTAGVVEENRVTVHSEQCLTCLSDEDAVPLVFVDPDPDFSGGSMAGEPIMLDQCRTSDRQTVVISVTHPITWAGTIYNDPLRASGVGPVNVIPGSVRVFVDGIERTLDVTVTTAPSLTVAFDNIGAVSQTALISITYQVMAPVNADRGSGWYNVTFATGGRDAACGVTRRAPIYLSIGNSLLDLNDLEPDILQSCAVNDVTLAVNGNYYLENVTNQQVATTTTSVDAALVTLVKSVIPATAAPEQTVIYAITATNSGPSAAANVVISDSLPASLTVLAVSSSAGGCTGLPCTIGDLAANRSAVVYVVARVAQTTTGGIDNTAVVTTTSPLAAGSKLTADASLSVVAAADVALEKTATITALAGERITYTLVAVNHGPSDAADVVVTDTLDSAVTVADDGVCSTSGTVVTCPPATMLVGDVITYTLVVTANSSSAPETLLENLAAVTAATADPNPANNSGAAWTRISDRVNLEVSKQGSPTQVYAGEQVTYTIVVTNAGPSLARDLIVQDALPAGLSLAAVTASDGGVCSDGLCEFGEVAVDATRAMTVVAHVDPGLAPMTATNVVTAAALASTLASPAAVSADTAITVLVNLTITKVLLNPPLQAGGVAMYQIVVTNTGPSNATGVVVTDTLPVSTTFAGGDAICTGSDRDVTCTVGGLATGASRSLTVLANVDPALGNGDSLTNTATISCLTSSVAITTTVVHTVSVPSGSPVNIGITKSGPPAIVAGEQLTYTLVVTNNASTTATVVSLADALPNGVSLVSITSTQGTCTDGIRCDLGTLTDTAAATITVVGLAASWITSGTVLVNFGHAAAAEREIYIDYANNLTAYTTTVSARALLTLTKHVNASSVSPGDRIVYRIVVTNSGPSAAPLTISDSAPISLTDLVVSSSAGGCTSLPCAVASLAPNAVVTVYVAATVAQTVTGAFVNSANVTTTAELVDGSSTADAVTVNVTASADLAVEKRATPAVLAGERITYTVVAVNRGPSDATSVSIVDTLSNAVTVADDGGCTPAGLNLNCSAGTLLAGERVTYTIVVTANSAVAAGALVTNSVTVASGTADPDLTNNHGAAATRVDRAAALAVSKSAQPSPATAGQLVTYTVLVTNSGPSDAANVTVYDLLPAGFSHVSSVADGGAFCLGSGCTFASVPAGATRTITLAAAVAANHLGGAVDNVVHVSATVAAPAVFTATTFVNIAPATTLTVSKVALNSPTPAGAETLYQILVTNTGAANAYNVQVREALPLGVYYAGGDSTCTGAGGQVVCNLGTLAPGVVRAAPLRLLVDSSLITGTQLVNSVTVTGTNVAAPASAQATSVIVTPVGAQTSLAFTKQAPEAVGVDGRITYTLRVTNTGPAEAVNVVAADALPNGVTVVSATPSQGTCNALVACQLGNLAVGASADVTIVGQLTGAAQDTVLDLANVAAVHSDNPRYSAQFIYAYFQTSASDTVTTTNLVLSGSLAGMTTTVSRTVIGGWQYITFTVAPTQSINAPGSLTFQLYRPCGTASSIGATLTANDYCGVPNTTSRTAGTETQEPQIVLSLFGGGSVNERNQTWSLSVRNFGLAAAHNVVVTNTLPVGFVYDSFTPDNILGVTVATGFIDSRQTLTFTFPTIPPQTTVGVDITGTATSCLPADTMYAGMTAACGIVGANPGTCEGSQLVSEDYTEGKGIILSSNDQAASIPLCGIGDVTLIVKNVAVDISIYDLYLSKTLTDATYVPGSAMIAVSSPTGTLLALTAFTPTSITPLTPTLPLTQPQVLVWDSSEMTTYPQSLIDAMASLDGRQEVLLTFKVQTYCSAPEPLVAAEGRAINACGRPITGTEDAQSVLVNAPSMRATKTVQNVTRGSEASRVYAAVGDVLVWKVTVENIGAVPVVGLFVTDTLPFSGSPPSTWFVVTDTLPITNYETGVTFNQTGVTLEWLIYTPTVSALPSLATRTFLITGYVSSEVCTAPKDNIGGASAACSADDVCTANPYLADASVDTQPVITLNAPNVTADQCSPGPLSFDVINNGARSGALVVTYTLPSGYAYDGLAAGTTLLPVISPTVGATTTLVFSFTEVGELANGTVYFNVKNDLASAGACRPNSGVGAVTWSYQDTCGLSYTADAPDPYTITTLRSDISNFALTPISQTVTSTDRYTFTLSVANTGNYTTNNLVITATLREGWTPASVQAYTSTTTATPPVTATVSGTTVITWLVGALGAGQDWEAQFSAIPLIDETDYRIFAEAQTQCSDGACTSYFSDTAYNMPLQALDKTMTGTVVSIGEPFTYTITVDFFGRVQYTNTALVDALPKIGGTPVVSVTGIFTSNTNPLNAWEWVDARPQAITFTTTSVTDTVFGPDQLTITVTGYISNEVAAQRGIAFTNAISLTSHHDGLRYFYTDDVTGVIKEPTLQIRKTVTPATNIRVDSVLTYTLVISHAAGSDATAYDVVITDVVPAVLAYVPDTLRVTAPAGTVVSSTLGNSLAITVSEYPTPSVPITVTYRATVTLAAEARSTYTNTAFVRYTSMPGDNPAERTGTGVGPNDYFTGTVATFSTAPISITKILQSNILPTIGDAITYTILITVPMGIVRNLVVTDGVPAGLLYISPTSFLTVTTAPNFDLGNYTITPSAGTGTAASTAILRFPAVITNTTGATAVISWTLRLLVVNDAGRTVNFNGAAKVNAVTMTYVNALTTTQSSTVNAAPVTIFEPLLHIGKTYMTADACTATLLIDNFNGASLDSSWVASSTGWALASGFLRAPTPNGQYAITNTSGSFTDFSYSAVFSSTDTSGDVGLIFRAQDGFNHYRLVWNRGGSGVYSLVRVVNNVTTTLASGGSGGYTTNRWYHLEIRAVGNAFTVYLAACRREGLWDRAGM